MCDHDLPPTCLWPPCIPPWSCAGAHNVLFPAFFLYGFGGPGAQLGIMSLMTARPEHKHTVIALFTGTLNASSYVFVLLRAMVTSVTFTAGLVILLVPTGVCVLMCVGHPGCRVLCAVDADWQNLVRARPAVSWKACQSAAGVCVRLLECFARLQMRRHVGGMCVCLSLSVLCSRLKGRSTVMCTRMLVPTLVLLALEAASRNACSRVDLMCRSESASAVTFRLEPTLC
jgi:hypothetical protein